MAKSFSTHPRTDEEKVKAKLVNLIQNSSKVDEVVALANAFAKLRAVELKEEDGKWGEDLPREVSPFEMRSPEAQS